MFLMTKPIISAMRRDRLENDPTIFSFFFFLRDSMHYNEVESRRHVGWLQNKMATEPDRREKQRGDRRETGFNKKKTHEGG